MSFVPSNLSDTTPAVPGSDSAAYDVASYYLDKAAHASKSYVTETKLLAQVLRNKALSAALPAGVYGHEVAILTDAAKLIGNNDPSTTALLLLISQVPAARAQAQGSNPLYQAQKTAEKAEDTLKKADDTWETIKKYAPYAVGILALGGGFLMLRGGGKSNPWYPDDEAMVRYLMRHYAMTREEATRTFFLGSRSAIRHWRESMDREVKGYVPKENPVREDSPFYNSWIGIGVDELFGIANDTKEGLDELSTRKKGMLKRSIDRTVRRATHADTIDRIYRKIL